MSRRDISWVTIITNISKRSVGTSCASINLNVKHHAFLRNASQHTIFFLPMMRSTGTQIQESNILGTLFVSVKQKCVVGTSVCR